MICSFSENWVAQNCLVDHRFPTLESAGASVFLDIPTSCFVNLGGYGLMLGNQWLFHMYWSNNINIHQVSKEWPWFSENICSRTRNKTSWILQLLVWSIYVILDSRTSYGPCNSYDHVPNETMKYTAPLARSNRSIRGTKWTWATRLAACDRMAILIPNTDCWYCLLLHTIYIHTGINLCIYLYIYI